MAKNKTEQTKSSVSDFISKVKDETKRDDSFTLIEIMREVTGFEPAMWGPSIIGFGSHHYVYESGHEGDMPLVAFSPRSTAIVLYCSGLDKAQLEKLGKHKSTGGCVYIKKLADVDVKIVKKIIQTTVKSVPKKF